MRFGLLLLLCGFIYPSLATTEIIMGYRTTEKMPYIHAEPSDDGFYFELYDEAAKRRCKAQSGAFAQAESIVGVRSG
ncbi:hypothetical protein ACS1UE_000735 [Vibrio vulnificus]